MDDVENFDDIIDFDQLTTHRVRNRHAPDHDLGFALSKAKEVADALMLAAGDLADYLASKLPI